MLATLFAFETYPADSILFSQVIITFYIYIYVYIDNRRSSIRIQSKLLYVYLYILFCKGGEGDKFYVILMGTVKVVAKVKRTKKKEEDTLPLSLPPLKEDLEKDDEIEEIELNRMTTGTKIDNSRIMARNNDNPSRIDRRY